MNTFLSNLTYLISYIEALWVLALDAAPWLVLGLIIGGLFKSLIPTDFLHKHLTTAGVSSIVKAAILGAPLPLCSCGVIPASMGLRQAGASKPATTSFLVSTPETGVDSISISYAMMGPFMAIVRPIAALFSALVTGLLVLFFADQDKVEEADEAGSTHGQSCCSSQSTGVEVADTKNTIWEEVKAGVLYAFDDLYPSILKWLVIGLLFAAGVQAFIPVDWLLQWGGSWMAMIVMLFVGIPMYVCATGSTPIAAGFLMVGISPGAVLVYLLAGPATNMATLGVVREQMGSKTMWLYLLGIVSSALFVGILVNLLAGHYEFIALTNHSHEMVPFVLQIISILLLVIWAFKPIFYNKAASSETSCCD